MTTSTSARGLDRPTKLALVQLSTYCWLLYAIGPITLLLRTEQGWSRALAGSHATAMAAGFTLAGAITTRALNALDEAALRRICMAGVALSLIGFAIARHPLVSLASAAAGGTSGALLVNMLNPSLIRRHGARAGSVMSLINAAGATVGSLAPLMVGAAAASRVGWRALLWVLGFAALAATLGRRSATGADVRTRPGASAPESGASHTRFRLAVAALFGGLVVEFTTSIFAADVIRTRAGLATADAAKAASVFIIGFALSRWLATVLVSRFAPARVMLTGYICAGLGLALVATTAGAVSVFAGLFLTGLGIGPSYPIMITLALRSAVIDSYRASARIGLGSGAVIAAAPFLLGALSDRLGLAPLLLSLSGTAAVSAVSVWRGFLYSSH